MEEKNNTIGQNKKGSWLTFRPDLKLLDATIRDGGLINDHKFDYAFVKAVYETCVASGVDYMEMGYKASKKIFSPAQHGPWKYCDENDLRKIVGENKTTMKISVMADAERTDYHTDFLPKEKSVIDCIRVASYIHQIPTALDMIKDAHNKGYETTFQLMAVSIVKEKELREALDLMAKSYISAIFIVDSFGALYSEQIRDLSILFLKALEETGKEVGIHAHNNQMLAYANTIEALILGANRVDATINGLGRGAGNCPLELLIGFLKNPKFHLRPVLECIEKHFVPLRKQLDWGYSIPYMLTGQLNVHPRDAIKMRQGPNPDDYMSFYDQITEEES